MPGQTEVLQDGFLPIYTLDDQIKDKLWKDSFWSDSYFLTTTGGANVDVLKVYIQQQGIEKPKRKYVRRK